MNKKELKYIMIGQFIGWTITCIILGLLIWLTK